MSRPIVLVKEELLSDIWYKHRIGVPVRALLIDNELQVALPTLVKLLRCVTIMEQASTQQEHDVYNIIHKSLFPEWVEADTVIQHAKQPKEWKYIGKFPLGKWEYNGSMVE